ncbi:MAG: c-type cytochrome [Gemmatimonadales bacterium]
MKVLKVFGVVVVAVILIGLALFGWASYAASRKLSRTYPTHTVDFPIPFPAGEQGAAAALERGKHLVEARYGCGECHGRNFAGGAMVDDPAIGRIMGPNLTGGKGSVTAGFRPADWDRIVRHGVNRDGRPALMPSVDFRQMSDQELSDIVVFLRSQPPVDREVPRPTLGPVGKVLLATGKLPLSADLIGPAAGPHVSTPPETAPTASFGRHVASTCMGCHRDDLGGGPIVGGDPSWPPAANLTPGPGGLGGWTFLQFVTALREGKRPDGTALRAPMVNMMPYAQKMTNVELEALWTYVKSVPAVAARH